jgi:16S rRNA (guanine527-N7)-methyltransferase
VVPSAAEQDGARRPGELPARRWADEEDLAASLRERYAAVPGMARFAELLSTAGVERGLLGPREVARLWPRHLANCAVVAEEVSPQLPLGARVADVGSGAGLPGVVWALVRGDLTVTLIEPLLRRATFLSEVVAELDLGQRVRVLRQRAEAVDDRFDAVTARAVARMPQLARWTLPLAVPGGWVIALKGSSADQEIEEAAGVIAALGGGPAEIRHFGAGILAEPTTAVLIPRVSAARRSPHRGTVAIDRPRRA